MGEGLTEYQEQRLELEQQKIEQLKKLRKDLKHQARMESIHKIIDELDIDKEDVETVFRFATQRIRQHHETEPVSEEEESGTTDQLGESIAKAVKSVTAKNVDVSVEVENEEE